MHVTRFWGAIGWSREEISEISDQPEFNSFETANGLLSIVQETDSSGSHQVLEPHLSLIGDVRLHDTHVLSGMLGGRFQSGPPSKDSVLVLAAYARWGSGCTARLSGEFSFAIWNDKDKALFLCIDHIGAKCLYYWRAGAKLVFASDPRLILRLPGVPRRLNRRKLSAHLVPHGWTFHDEETLHAEILSLPPATWLNVTPQGWERQTYWAPEIKPDLIPVREADAFDAARELLFAAVRNRIRGCKSVSVRLSGGLDSSAITAIAAGCLAESNQSLITLSHVVSDDQIGHVRDERDYIDEFRSWPNIQIKHVSAEGRGPFDFLDNPNEFEAAFGTSPSRFVDAALNDAAAANHADIVLDGGLGEFGPTANGRGYFLELATNFQWCALAKEMRARNVLLRSCGRPGSATRTLAGEFLNVFQPNRGWRGSLMLTGNFQKECVARSLRKRHWKDHRARQLDQIRAYLLLHATRHVTGVPSRVDLSYPLLDKPLLEFCLAAPGSMKVRGGYSRFIMRKAMDGILPKRIQWRTTKEPFSPDYYLRFNAQLPKARDFLSSIRRHDPVRTIVDVDRISELLQPLDPSRATPEALTLPVNFYLILFLRQFAEFRP